MIREKLQQQILQTIDNHSRFDNFDFKIESVKETRSKEANVTISYNYEKKYKMTFVVPTKATPNKSGYGESYIINGNVCPGPLAIEENFSIGSEGALINTVINWLDNIWEELTANPVLRQVEKNKEDIDILMKQFVNMKEEFFTKEEANEIKKRLEELENRLKNEVQSTVSDEDELKIIISNLHKDIETLKATVEVLKKPNWIKSLFGKSFKWLQNPVNRQILKEGYEFIKEVIPSQLPPGH